MDTVKQVHTFDACEVRTYDDHVRTRFFADDSESVIYPPNTAEYVEVARSHGYGDPMQYCAEHEVVHALLADTLGRPHSWSVWSAAHRTFQEGAEWSDRVKAEEHLVNSFQRYLNTGEFDAWGLLQKKLGRRQLAKIVMRAVSMLRPWLLEVKDDCE